MINDQDSYREKIIELKNSYFYNLGKSGEAAADYIIERLSGKRSSGAAGEEDRSDDASQNNVNDSVSTD